MSRSSLGEKRSLKPKFTVDSSLEIKSDLSGDETTYAEVLRPVDKLSPEDLLFLEGMNNFQAMLDSVPGPLLRVANSKNNEPPPTNFVYITKFIYGKGVPKPDPAFLTGCDCQLKDCGTAVCSCVMQTPVPSHGQHTGNYTRDGRLKILAGRQPFIYECNMACSCSSQEQCLNRVIQKGRAAPLEIFQMGDARGWAVRAINFIPAGTFIDLYHGEIITDQEADKRFMNIYKGDERSLYLFDLDFSAEAGAKADFTIDAYYYGSVSRFFNHSCDPNLLIVPCFIDHIDQSLHFIAFFAAKDIKSDEELCFDYTNEMYKSTVASGRKNSTVYEKGHIRCLCGASNCRKYVYPTK